ncbi:hypothetical protein BJY04DRAFT_133749 [Aspergillus karnatakaensis]|uniref:uncharacterized protein n=1 Tax=Aspergillus karnatakaensis TaxID=1810916 RepID=UPI003CCCB136
MTTVAPADTVYREQDFDGTFQESSPATTPAQLGNFYHFTPISPYYQGETNPAQHPFNFVPATRSPFNTAPHSPWSSFGPPARPQGAVPSARQLGSWHQRFSGLSSELLRDLNLVESGMITGKNLLTTPACHASTSMPDHPYSAGGHNSPYYSIGRMLQSADDFYCVLQELRGQTMSTKSWPLTMSVGESRSMEELRTSGYTGCDRRMSAVGNTAVTGVEGNGELTGRTVDALLALLIRTCHTTLLRICQAVVSLIRDSLPMAKNRSSFEPVLPVVRLDGFDVGYRQDLQIRILLQVAAHLFDEIDEILRDLKLGDGVSPSLEALLSTNVLGVTLDGACDAPMIKESIASVCKSIHEQLGNGGELR